MRVAVRAAVAMILALIVHTAAGQDTYRQIKIDDRFDDWDGVPIYAEELEGNNGEADVMVERVWLANDNDFVYLRLVLRPATYLHFPSFPIQIYFDTDCDAATGWQVGGIGSDFAWVFPRPHGIEQTATEFTVGSISPAAARAVNAPTYRSSEYEMRISRQILFPVRQTPVFAGPTFRIALSMGGTLLPRQPAGLTYTFADGEFEPYLNQPLRRVNPRDVRLMSYNVFNNSLIERPEDFAPILQAIRPDIISFQEIDGPHGQSPPLAALLNTLLPTGTPAGWYTYSNGFGEVIAARYPLQRQRRDTNPSSRIGNALALVDLPDALYAHDLYLINPHWACCCDPRFSNCGKRNASRQRSADAYVNWIRDLKEPGGFETLPPGTPIVVAGDLNMVGSEVPLRTLLTGDIQDETLFGPDAPPDWEETDLTDAIPLHNGDATAYTFRVDAFIDFMPGRYDFCIYTDSVASVRRSFVLNTADTASPELSALGLDAQATGRASDHLPIVIDFAMAAECQSDPPLVAVDFDGGVDTYIDAADPLNPHGSDEVLFWVGRRRQPSDTTRYTLMRFDDLFGPNGIAASAKIEAATLSYKVMDNGDAGWLNRAAVWWDSDVTYNTFGPQPGVQADELTGVSRSAPASSHRAEVDVTTDLRTWQASNAPNPANLGWILQPDGEQRVRLSSSNFPDPPVRPRLTVLVRPLGEWSACDTNCDGDIDAFDIEPFLELLFGGGQPCAPCSGDANRDGLIDAFDIEAFTQCLFP